jgi:myo-inositol 2-dehydrogenase/D-chiro-inositol 1-dehydrogenase
MPSAPKPSSPHRIGLIGCGGIARAHREAYRAAGATVAVVYDPIPAAAERFAAESSARVVGSLAELAASGIDAASVCSPPGAHREACLALIEQGVPVLCEKPLAADLAGARAIAEAAWRSSAPFMVGFCHRFHGPILELKSLIDRGALGRLVLVRVAFTGELALTGGHRADPLLAGGGCVADNGAHAVDLFRFLAGDIVAARALVANVVQPAAVEDAGVVALRAVSGTLGEIATTFSSAVGLNRVELLGSEGAATVSYWMDGEPELRWRARGHSAWTTVDCSRHPDRFAAQVGRFLACARSGEPCSPSAEDGLAAVVAISAAYDSSRIALVGGAHA